MERYDNVTETSQLVEAGFSSQLKFLTSINDLSDLVEECEQSILFSFDNYIKHGSGSINLFIDIKNIHI